MTQAPPETPDSAPDSAPDAGQGTSSTVERAERMDPSTRFRRAGSLHVPLIVRLGHKRLSLGQVFGLTTGAILELRSRPEAPLEIFVGGARLGFGRAVKVGENYGVEILSVGSEADVRAVINSEVPSEDQSAEAAAEALLDGQV
ncbi:MAG: FliM/FliN family flagellar motor C-terminal domain-containing protein [Planctomycetota bacterium]